MKARSPVTVLVLSLVTFGIYALVWQIQTKDEMNRAYGAGIPTAWLLLVPFLGPLLWMWKWSAGASQATGTPALQVFLMMALLPIVGIPVMTSKFNAAVKPTQAPAAIAMRAA